MRIACILVLLTAIMPQVLYLGHPRAANDSAVHTASGHHERQDEAAARHANHCHVGPKSCAPSEGAAEVAPLSGELYAVVDGGAFHAIERTQPLHTFALYQRLEKPPQAA